MSFLERQHPLFAAITGFVSSSTLANFHLALGILIACLNIVILFPIAKQTILEKYEKSTKPNDDDSNGSGDSGPNQ